MEKKRDMVEKKYYDPGNLLIECFKEFIHLLDGHDTPESFTFVVFMNKNHHSKPFYIYPYKDENTKDFAIRSGALKKEMGSKITIVYHKNLNSKEIVTITHHDTKTYKIYSRYERENNELLGWFEIFEIT